MIKILRIKLIITTLLLMPLLHSMRIHAYNLIYVNATDFPISVTEFFSYDLDSTILCKLNPLEQFNTQQIEPGGVFSHPVTGCLLSHLTVELAGQHLDRHIFNPLYDDYRDFQHIKKGTFVIRQVANGGYEIAGPYVERGGALGTLFLVNATGFGMQYYADYHTLLCAHDQGGLLPGQVVQLNISACLTSELYGYNIAIGMGQSNKSTNKYTGSTGNGTFVFRKKAGISDEFEVVGPFRQ